MVSKWKLAQLPPPQCNLPAQFTPARNRIHRVSIWRAAFHGRFCILPLSASAPRTAHGRILS